ncbi:GntR family transcriptional regulator/MocR family aminotransferase [Kribbella sp. VKM Ac-2527]|uniref:GntR family transcriptional regulator/MocR family aminotransferase n=1 Tax=Kribbella caucasensis TaxID=2512215 RepID=A0A4R6KID2_9ACTN|nr:PLP-dependent aminotransferase family protein [Kribbella sp. VKM Ac-2527]TDO50803.1 GntR family transcriptional regulator/MocR family aminotransferase [Kribbella sp. VKM Ac-2527]
MNRSNPGDFGRSITAGADFLQLSVEDAPAGGLSDWLAGRLRAAISDGRLPLGSRLPASRVLAAELQVSRGVVTEAYQRLTEDGHIAGRGRSGTEVVATPISTMPTNGGTTNRVTSNSPALTSSSTPPAPTRRERAVVVDEPGLDIFDVMRAVPARIDLTPGVPDLAAFPRAAWLKAERSVLTDLSAASFGYGDPAGTPALRVAVSNWLARNRGVQANPDDLIIVSGVAQAIGLIAQVLQRDGITTMAVEDPGSLGSRQHLQNWGLRTPPIPVDTEGLRVDELRRSTARAVMVTPAHQFPTGVVLEGERRRELMQWAADGGLIVEDDYDAEHRYDRPPVPALRAMLSDHVIYTGSISKLLAPALRIGWMLPPAQYQDALVDAKRLADLGNAALPQLVLAQLMESGELEKQLRFVRRRHRQRRDAMIDAISNHLPTATVHGAAAGLHLTITFDSLDDVALAAATLERGIKTQPLSWHSQRPGPPGLVLGYAARTPTEITEAVAILGELVRRI